MHGGIRGDNDMLARLVDLLVWLGLAQDAVSACTEALMSASKAITCAKGPADGQLFLVMHLLKLREQVVFLFQAQTVRRHICMGWPFRFIVPVACTF